ncbi:MAG: DUF2721 domain-containing protein [Pseudomonadota bacterium]
MMIELFAAYLTMLGSAAPTDALDVLQTNASTARVQKAVELSLAPAFLLVGIGSLMNVMMARLIWLAGRIERLSDPTGGACDIRVAPEVEWLRKRRAFARVAIKLSTGAAATISVVIAVLFVSAFMKASVGVFVAILWVLTIGLLIAGLGYFLRETLLAADGPHS